MSQSRVDRDFVYVSGPDWWSRIVAIGSLAVAGTALYWGYLRDQQPPRSNVNSIADVKSTVADAIQQIRDEASSERRRLDTHVATAIDQVDKKVQLLAEQQSNESNTPTQFEEPIAENAPATPPGNVEPKDAGIVQLIPRPEIIEVFAVLRVDDLAERPTLIVRNRGQMPAQITHVRFEPTSDFDQVPTEVAEMELDAGSDNRLVVQFQPTENLSANPQTHGTYLQALEQPFQVGLTEDVAIQVVIANSAHRRFGLRGRLTLLSNETEIARFENIAVPFVD